MIAFPHHLGSPETAGPPPAADRLLPAFVPADTTLPPIPIPDDTEALGEEIARLAAHINAATYHLMVLIQAFDERMDLGWGFRSTAHWLSWRTSMAPGTAREKVRVARALPELPRISAAMARGEMSFSKVRALTRVATPENEAKLLDVARHSTAAQLEKFVRSWLLVDRLQDPGWEEQRHESRFVQLYPDHDGSYVIRGRLDPEVGALLEKALEWAGEALFKEKGEVEELVPRAEAPTFDQRRADALGLVAERAFAAAEEETETSTLPSSRADRFQVVVHVEAADLVGVVEEKGAHSSESLPSENVPAETPEDEREPECGCGSGRIPPHIATRTGSLPISIETVRMLASDASLVVMAHDEEGGVLDVGRKRRTIPPAIRRALEYRDKGCRFPGCGCGFTEGHHIIPWEKGGETKLDNLVSLCWRHHRAVHKGGYGVEVVWGEKRSRGGRHGARRKAAVDFRFYDPLGRVLKEVPDPPPLPADPVGALVRTHAEAGIEPDGWTATPDWRGEALDYDWAISVLWTPVRREGD